MHPLAIEPSRRAVVARMRRRLAGTCPRLRCRRSITITVCRRPHYLERVLESLSRNDTRGYALYMALEPEGMPHTLEVARSAAELLPTCVLVNRRRRGVRDNPYRLLRHVFDVEQSEGNVYLEEDTIVSPDALRLANWYFEEVDKRDLMSLQLFRYRSDPSRRCDLYRGRDFNSLGVVITSEQWRRWFRPFWNDERATRRVFSHRTGWDWAMRAALALHEDLRTLMPRCARANHIGREGGVHCIPRFHDENFAALQMNEDATIDGYRIEDGDDLGGDQPRWRPD